MSHPKDTADHTPKGQASEAHGSIKGPQVTDRMMREKDLARGSETDTRGSSRGRI
ncbi:MAG: hypothetical protein WA842_09640 [Croceibacterium sp.]